MREWVFGYDSGIYTEGLQFYTRADIHPHQDQGGTLSLPDRRVLVRYYLNPYQQTLCRQVVEDDQLPPTHLETSDWPTGLTTTFTDPKYAGDPNALCENVRSVRFLLRCRDSATTGQGNEFCYYNGGWLVDRTFTPVQGGQLPATTDDPTGYHKYTHIVVRLEIRDNAAMQRPFGTDTSTVIPSRTFVKVLQIPTTIQ